MAYHTRPSLEALYRLLGSCLQRVGSDKTGDSHVPYSIKLTLAIQTYPSSVQNLNRLTMTVDVDIYDGKSQQVEIPAMPEGSPIKVKIISLALTVDARWRR